ncbi:MAG: prepilin-type N-terminal cleavage/methylation domain-containing protein [Bdellovibrionaceae bacterium]|nr:prepilin-type N-terminal cleavage/methylation domain-containing protein [Pseudobdellovibrionaceae bacterium]
MTVRSQALKNKAGFSLVELMIGVGLLSLVALGIAGTASSYFKSMGQMRLTSARMEIIRQIRSASHNPIALANSKTLETALGPCLSFTLGGPTCLSKDSGGQLLNVPFTLTSELGATDIIAGPEAAVSGHQPVYYDKDGRRCTDPSVPADQCPLQAIVSYSAHCQSGEAACQGADALSIFYIVKRRDDALEKDPNLRTATGTVMTNLREGKYVHVPSVVAMGSGQALSEVDMAQGKMLSVGAMEQIQTQVLLRDSDAIDTLEVRVWNLPAGCDFTNIGTTGCERPPLENYALKSSVPVSLAASSAGRFSLSFVSGNTGFAEIVILSMSAGEYKLRSNTLLRLKTPVLPVASVTGPNPLRKDCDDPKPAKFTFQASDPAGVASYAVTVSPALPNAATTLPGFSFNTGDSNPQNFDMPYEDFQAGVTYTIKFSVTNSEGLTSTATHVMPVALLPNPSQDVTIQSPTSTSFLRSSDSLVVNATVRLECGKTVSKFEVSTAKSGGGAWMSPRDISCSPTTGPTDVETFLCTQTFACKDWLNLNNCGSYAEPEGTKVQVTGQVSPNSGSSTSKSVEFTVGTKVSVAFTEKDTRHEILNGYYDGSSLPLRVKFGAAPNTPAYLKLKYPGGTTYPFVCPAGSVDCTIAGAPLPPASGALTLEVDTGSTADILVVAPFISQVNYTNNINSCDAQLHPVSCPTGTTRRILISKIGAHDATFGGLSPLIIPVFPNANIDFFTVHRQNDVLGSTSAAAISLELRHYNSNGDMIAYTMTMPATQVSDVPAKLFYLTDDYWKYHSGQMYASSVVEVSAGMADLDTTLVRQCYCE